MKPARNLPLPWHLFAGIALIIAVIFLTYGWVERHWLGHLDIEIIHTFHVLRGIGASVLVAAFLLIYFLRVKGKTTVAILGGTLSTLPVDEKAAVRERVLWFVRLRWVAVVSATIAAFISCRLTAILPKEKLWPLLMCILALGAANVFFTSSADRTQNPYRLLLLQVVVDLVLLTFLLHFSGGIENPVYLAYIFHIIIAGILLSPRHAVLLTVLATLLFSGMALAEAVDLIPHSFVALFPHGDADHPSHASHDPLFVVSRILSLVFVLAFTAFFTIQIREQLRQAERSILQAGKMAAIGELAGGVAHEINNPIGIMSGKLRLLVEGAAPKGLPENVVAELKKIDAEAMRIARLTQALLSFSRPAIGKRTRGDFNKIISLTTDLIRDRLKESHIALEWKAADHLTPVAANPDEMKQVILNLVDNAIDAMPNGGTLSLTTLSQGGDVRMIVRDTGTGIPEENLHRLFEPFFTTKPYGQGTGLGLAVIHGLVKSHGGTIRISSREGSGTLVEVSLPAAG